MENLPKSDFKKNRAIQAIRKKAIKRIVVVLLVVVVLAALTVWIISYSRSREKNLPGVYYPPVGQEHIVLNAELPKPYISNPPSSGAHFQSPASWGIYDYEVNDKIFVHNLEHGGIWIAYKPTVSVKVVDDLKAIVNEFGGSKIVMAPRSANDADIAIVAWSRVFKFNVSGGILTDQEKEGVRSFYKAFKNRGPEFVPDIMPGINPKSVQ